MEKATEGNISKEENRAIMLIALHNTSGGLHDLLLGLGLLFDLPFPSEAELNYRFTHHRDLDYSDYVIRPLVECAYLRDSDDDLKLCTTMCDLIMTMRYRPISILNSDELEDYNESNSEIKLIDRSIEDQKQYSGEGW